MFPGSSSSHTADFRLDFQPKKSVHAKIERTVLDVDACKLGFARA
jgi:hypothetical protein